MADTPWLKAIETVMRASGKPMHYTDITQAIIDGNYRKDPGATPANTVSANLGLSLKNNPKSPFKRLGNGMYTIKSVQPEATGDENIDEPADEEAIIASTDKNPIKSFGMYWSRGRVRWTQRMENLLGEQVSGSAGINFTKQCGVYLLHDTRGVVYVGKAVDQGLGVRLYQHTRDRLSGRWDRFSWFGVRGVNDDGSLADIPVGNFEISSIITVMEALLIEGLEPPQNRRQGDGFGGLEFIQKDDPEIERDRKKALIEQFKQSIG